MTQSRRRTANAAAVLDEIGTAGAALMTGSSQPVRSRWTWQPILPELWLRAQEGLCFRNMIKQQKKEA